MNLLLEANVCIWGLISSAIIWKHAWMYMCVYVLYVCMYVCMHGCMHVCYVHRSFMLLAVLLLEYMTPTS